MNLFVLDGKAQIGVVTSIDRGDRFWSYAQIENCDRKHTDNDLRVELTTVVDPNGALRDHSRSETLNSWVSVWVDVNPSFGLVRLWYDGRRIDQSSA